GAVALERRQGPLLGPAAPRARVRGGIHAAHEGPIPPQRPLPAMAARSRARQLPLRPAGGSAPARPERGVRKLLHVSARTVFDAAYYQRFYRDRPVHDRRRVGRLAEGVLGMCGWWGVPVRSVLDVGAGPGYWRDWLATNRPRVRYRSVDFSAYAAARYGHEQR